MFLFIIKIGPKALIVVSSELLTRRTRSITVWDHQFYIRACSKVATEFPKLSVVRSIRTPDANLMALLV